MASALRNKTRRVLTLSMNNSLKILLIPFAVCCLFACAARKVKETPANDYGARMYNPRIGSYVAADTLK